MSATEPLFPAALGDVRGHGPTPEDQAEAVAADERTSPTDLAEESSVVAAINDPANEEIFARLRGESTEPTDAGQAPTETKES